LQEATKKPVKLSAAVKHKSATLEPEKQEPEKLGVAAAERIAAKQVEQETKAIELAVAMQGHTAGTAKTAVNCGLAKTK
jgi:hypothetical protein